jgi:hypothetical protein
VWVCGACQEIRDEAARRVKAAKKVRA